jgi:hypothetical protein
VTRIRTRDLWLLLFVSAVQVLLATALRILRLPVLRASVARWRSLAQRAVHAPHQRISWAIEAVGRRLPGVSTCFVRALTADLLLVDDAHPGRVVVGVRRSPAGALESHAWFEQGDRIAVGAAGAGDYRPFAAFAAGAGRRH